MTTASKQVFVSTPNWTQLSGIFKKAVNHLWNYSHQQKALNCLSELNDAALRDVGLTRNDLDLFQTGAEVNTLMARKRERIRNW